MFTFLVSSKSAFTHGSVVYRWVLSFRWGEAGKGWQQLNLRTEWIAWLSGIPLQIVNSLPKLLIRPERQRAHACPPWHLQCVALLCVRFVQKWKAQQPTELTQGLTFSYENRRPWQGCFANRKERTKSHLSFPLKQFTGASVVRAKLLLK